MEYTIEVQSSYISCHSQLFTNLTAGPSNTTYSSAVVKVKNRLTVAKLFIVLAVAGKWLAKTQAQLNLL